MVLLRESSEEREQRHRDRDRRRNAASFPEVDPRDGTRKRIRRGWKHLRSCSCCVPTSFTVSCGITRKKPNGIPKGRGEIELDASRGNLFRSINRTRGTRGLFFTPRDRFLVSVAPFINFVAGKRF